MASLLGQREDSHSGQMGSTGEGLGLNQLPPPSAPANLGQDLPSLAHLEMNKVSVPSILEAYLPEMG